MPDIDPLRFQIKVDDPEAIPNAMNEAAAATEEASSAMVAGMERFAEIVKHPITYLEELKEEIGSTGRVAAEQTSYLQGLMDQLEEQKAEAAIKRLQEQLQISRRDAQSLFDAMNEGAEKASGSFANLGDTITRRLIVSEIVMNLRQLPTVINDIIGALSGWDKEAQKAYESMIKENAKYLAVLDEARDVQIKLRNDSAPATATREIIEAKRAEMAAYQRAAAAAQENITAQTGMADGAGILSTAIYELHSAGVNLAEGGGLTELKKQMQDAQEHANSLALEIQKLSTVKLPEDQHKQDKEETKKDDKQEKLLAAMNDSFAKGAEIRQEIADRVAARIQKNNDAEMAAYDRLITAEADRAEWLAEFKRKSGEKELAAYTQLINSEARLAEWKIMHENEEESRQMAFERTNAEATARANEKIAREEAAKIKAEHLKLTAEISKDLFSNMDKWLTGQEKFADAWKKSIQSVELSVLKSIENMAAGWLAAHLQHVIMAQKAIFVDAKAAAAKAWASAPNPIIGAIEAAGTFAAVEALAVFHQGGVAPDEQLSLLKRNEMVLDPSLSAGMQALIMSGRAGKGGGGTTVNNTLHYNAAGGSGGSKEDASQMARILARKARYQPSYPRSI